ncbi:MAG: nitroreductase family protein [Nitrospinota bacterium]|nr:nitroreductase family protein [Nitrospinota bacterium]HJM43894.1 nitroreductase family protein [Nitrospinota bacterium]
MDIFEAIERGLAPPGNAGAAPPDGGAPSEEQMNKVLEAARWAASAYNTQPWHFQVLRAPACQREAARVFSAVPEDKDPADGRAWLLCHLDRNRMLPVADPLGSESYIALGTACLNIQAASAALGLACNVWGPSEQNVKSWRPVGFSFPDKLEPYLLFGIGGAGDPQNASRPAPAVYHPDSFKAKPVQIQPRPQPDDGMEALYCIRSRQTDRTPMLRTDPWPEDSVRMLSAARRAFDAHGAREAALVLAEDSGKTMELTRLQERAWRQATGDRGRFRETCGWLRFQKKEWKQRGDGEWVGHFGLTGVKRTLARLGLKTPLAPLAMALGAHRVMLRKTETTGAYLTGVVENSTGRFAADEPFRRRILNGVGAGIQALWLTGAALGAGLQFQTSIIVQERPKAGLREILDIPDAYEPLFLIRMGYPQRDPHYTNIRRNPAEVISRTAPT